jgi:hypothetical protein
MIRYRTTLRTSYHRKLTAMSLRISSRLTRLGIVLASLAGGPASSQPMNEVATLDALVEQQRYGEALRSLEPTAWPASDKLKWLRKHAEAGHVPPMYSLSATLFASDLSESLKWYARGRLARTLDAAECADATASWGARVALDKQTREVADAGVADPRAFSEAISDALAWDAKRDARPSAAWICGGRASKDPNDGLLPQPKRSAERADTRTTMEINAKAVQDFYKAVEAGASSGFVYLDSGAVVPPTGYLGLAGWLDNRRLLFVGTKPGESDAGELGSLFRRLMLWDTDTNTLEIIVYEKDGIRNLCVDGERVVYLTHPGPSASGKPTFASGQFPHFGKRPFGANELRMLFRQADCEPPPAPPPGVYIGNMTWLRKGDGYIVHHTVSMGKGSSNILHLPDGSTKPLDVGDRNGGSVLTYALFRNAYLLRGGPRDHQSALFQFSRIRRPGDTAVLFWLHTNGDTEAVEIPYGVWDSGNPPSTLYRATRLGLVLSGGHSEEETAPGYAGLYLFEHSGPTRRLASGPSFISAVSPDGCRIAYANATDDLAARKAMILKMVDVCRKD